jgi:hypothetical protein
MMAHVLALGPMERLPHAEVDVDRTSLVVDAGCMQLSPAVDAVRRILKQAVDHMDSGVELGMLGKGYDSGGPGPRRAARSKGCRWGCSRPFLRISCSAEYKRCVRDGGFRIEARDCGFMQRGV